MQKSPVIKENTTLPPNVRGKSRGFIEIGIINIQWSNDFLTNRFKNLEIIAKIIWWGQSKLSPIQLVLTNSTNFKLFNTVQYTILTNCKLFYNYLINCEPIKILLFTKTSNYNIGVVKVRIPSKILNICRDFLFEDTIACTESQNFQIESQKGVKLGKLTLQFKMMFYDPISDRENFINTTKNSNTLKCDLDKEIDDKLIPGFRSYRDFKQKTKCEAEKEKCSSRVINYLSGRKMSKKAEEQALKEIQRTSPLSDTFLENFSINIPKSPECLKILPEIDQKFNFCTKVDEKLDSLYLNIKCLKLLPDGIREVYVKSLIKTTFTIECKISPNFLDSDLKRILNYDVIRFYSNTFDDKEQRIDFNKDAIRSVKLICNETNEFLTEHSEILFTIWWRKYGSRYSHCLGTTKFRFTNLFKTSENENIKLKVKTCTAGVHVADLHCKIIIGSNICNIGTEFFGLKNSAENCHRQIQVPKNLYSICCYQNDKIKKTPNNQSYNSNTSNENSNPVGAKQPTSSPLCPSINLSVTNQQQIDQKDQDNSNVQTIHRNNLENHHLLKGLLYLGEIRNMDSSNYFCVARAFWKDDPSSSGFPCENNFNFIEVFSIINDTNFLERVRNNVLVVELWQKSNESHEKLFGIIRLPLHQFYIAFRDPVLANHLCKAKLPVISNDGMAPIVSPLSGIVCGQIQSLLCIGTEEQLTYIKQTRGFNLNCVFDNNLHISNSSEILIPQLPVIQPESHNILNEISTPLIENQNISVGAENLSLEVDKNNKEKLSNILGNFLDNLTQRLPSSSSSTIFSSTNTTTVEQQQIDQQNSLRRTSDLLDILQKALMQPPKSTSNTENSTILETISTQTPALNTFKIFLEIECALHLPRNPVKMISKKNNKRNKGKQSRFPPNEEPSAYVTFQAEEGYGQMFKSHEGMVYATNVVEKCSNPSWGKRFEICLSSEYLTKDNKPFVLRVWRKAATDLAHCRLLPTPMEDSIIGVSSVDLTVFMARMPFISGWYNIIDFSGKVNGQIKLNMKPLEDVSNFKASPPIKNLGLQNVNNISFLNRNTSNNSNFEVGDLSLSLGMDMSLSRAFKRKLVELEEINQRLRARLLDVTGEADPDIDLSEVDDEQMDEFERDLNTECNEDGESIQTTEKPNDSFAWLHDSNYNDGEDKRNLSSCLKQSRPDINECSNQEKIKMISEFLKKTEISSDNPNKDNENK